MDVAAVHYDRAEKLEAALVLYRELDDFHTKCEDCMEMAQAPEMCEHCFPYADKARLAMREALSLKEAK